MILAEKQKPDEPVAFKRERVSTMKSDVSR